MGNTSTNSIVMVPHEYFYCGRPSVMPQFLVLGVDERASLPRLQLRKKRSLLCCIAGHFPAARPEDPVLIPRLAGLFRGCGRGHDKFVYVHQRYHVGMISSVLVMLNTPLSRLPAGLILLHGMVSGEGVVQRKVLGTSLRSLLFRWTLLVVFWLGG